MKRGMDVFLAAVVLLAVLPTLARADFERTSWQFYKEIDAPRTIGPEYAFFEVDAEIHDGSFGNLAGLRIIDSDGLEIPYQIVTKRRIERREEYFPKLLNNSYLEGRYNSFVLDMGEERPEINELAIVTESDNFTRRVSVEGGNDHVVWNTLVEDAYIFDFSRNIRSRHLRVEFPASNFRYVRVKIHDDGGGRLEVGGAKAYRVKTEPAETESWPLSMVERKENAEKKTSIVILDARHRGLPIDRIDLSVSSRNYHRNVRVDSSVDRESWAALGSGVIFNYDMAAFKRTDNTISIGENVRGRYFRLTIENYDDRPIEVSGATGGGLVRRVVLPTIGKSPCYAYFGNLKAKIPRYDLAHRMRYIDTESLPRLGLRTRGVNADYVEPRPTRPWTERHEYLIWVMMAAVIAALALLIFNLMRKTPPQEP